VPADGVEAFDGFCAWAYPQLVAALDHIVADAAVAEELAQEALIRAFQRWDRVSAMRSPLGWTVHVGTNLARSVLRRRMVRWRAHRLLAAEGREEIREIDPAVRVTVVAALSQLTVPQREVVVLRYFLGLTTVEIGEVLGLEANAVRQRTHRALHALRRHLTEPGTVREPSHDT
jgi:RNA polymerase sigma factor (sigma-70 family)